MRTNVRWSDWENQGLEFCTLIQESGSLSLEGAVMGTRGGQYGAHYFVQTDELFRTRKVEVRYIGGPDLRVESDGNGHWRDMITNAPLAELDGCFDVDIGVTPATNMLPIKRLSLLTNESQDIHAAYVPLPSQIEGIFLPQRADQRYTCLTPNSRYLYEGLFRNFSTKLVLDKDGLVIDYPETFRRM